MSEEQTTTSVEAKPKKKRAPAKPKPSVSPTQEVIQEQTEEKAEVKTEEKSNDSLFHVPFIVLLVISAIAGTSLINAGLNSGKTDQQLQELKTEYRGYTSGVKDSR